MLKKLAAIIVLSFAFAGTASADALNDAMAEYEAANYKAALAGFKPLAEQGNATAQTYMGILLNGGGSYGIARDRKEALKWFTKAVEQGDAEGQFKFGNFYTMEYPETKENLEESVKWYTKAAEQGHAEAQWHLGLAYYIRDPLIPQDYNEAVKWLRKSAEQGFSLAQNTMGSFYESGLGVPVDYVLAYKWYNLASVSPYDWGGGRSRDKLARMMTPEQIAEAQRLSREWKPY